MKKILSWMNYIFSHYTLGFVITGAYALLSLNYYNATHLEEGQQTDSFLIRSLQIAHQKTIDFRLQQRGPRAPSKNIALLAVDEQSVLTLGRWPWPRELIAKTINKAVSLGAKVIAFDAVFSEESANPAKEIFEKLKKEGALSSIGEEKFSEELVSRDSDRIFSSSIKQNSSHIVMGSFYDSNNNELLKATYPNRCFNYIYESSPAYKIWENEEVFLAIVDQNDVYIPDAMAEIYKEHLKVIATEITQNTPSPKNLREQLDLRWKIHRAQAEYCSNWLDPKEDVLYPALVESWPHIKAEEDASSFPFNTFEEFVNSFKDRYRRNLIPVADNWVMNTPLISSEAKNTGYFNAHLDDDGTIRRKQLVVRNGEHYVPSISLKSFLLAMGYNAQVEISEDAKYESKVIKKFSITNSEDGQPVFDVPVDRQGSLMINYAGPQNMFPYLGVSELLSDHPTAKITQNVWDPNMRRWDNSRTIEVNKAEWVKDKIFVFGATAVGIYDLRVTPFDENFPGAETHLNVIDNLFRRDFLRPHPDEDLRMPLALLAIGIILTIAISRLGALPGLALTFVAMAATMIFDKYYCFTNGYIITIIHPFILILTLYVSLTFYKYFSEEKNKRELRSTFQKYVSPAIVEEILSDPKKIELGGRKTKMTVFFSDVRGFTTISEKLDPHELSNLLNSYLTPMTEIVFKNRGTLDKYMGDAIMAFFGAPIYYSDHAKYACRTALEHIEKLKELRNEYIKKGLPPIDIGIGLNTGEMSVGNMGSETVRSYTVMGDAVNLGSRLEGINKQYGTRIIISEFTYEEVKRDFFCREIDWVQVKGKVLPVKIYELISEKKPDDKVVEMLKWFQEGYQKYHEMAWAPAMDHFKKALLAFPEDPVSQLYVQRCEEFMAEPPPSDWDGVFVMHSK